MVSQQLDELRVLTVAHQTEGECKTCDARFAKILRVMHRTLEIVGMQTSGPVCTSAVWDGRP